MSTTNLNLFNILIYLNLFVTSVICIAAIVIHGTSLQASMDHTEEEPLSSTENQKGIVLVALIYKLCLLYIHVGNHKMNKCFLFPSHTIHYILLFILGVKKQK
jgi:hypothetical protein